MTISGATLQRLRISVRGIVQGVGFRPFVYGQAQRLRLGGFVLNDSNGVTIEVEGTSEAIEAFVRALHEQAPPLARIDAITTEPMKLRQETSFVIAHSQATSSRSALISPDSATCDDCLRELFDPRDRRYHYPFINCTNCGPRFTIVQDIPYDRVYTTMRAFPLCPACQEEYDDPGNRRFHAQPNACPICGPQVELLTWSGESARISDLAADPIASAALLLARDAILAIKGLGGYHLACSALLSEVVERLRRRKHREAKPLALMVADLDTARTLCAISEAEAALLASPRRPIVLLQRHDLEGVAPAVAPEHDTLGVMLPYTPLHHLLLHAYAREIGPGHPAALVMTSGNLSEEPIAYRDEEARARLSSIADGMLTHNRAIHMRCDDSVVRIAAGNTQYVRRSRGYAPEPIPLSWNCPVPLLACGGHLKNTFCLGRERQAFMSHHIGDLENMETLLSFREGIEHYQHLFGITPRAVAYDLHPEYLATKFALDLDVPMKTGVQHHHAHIASVLAEHGLKGPVIGIAADGTGYGIDGAVWGGEVFIADLTGFERYAHLRYVPLPGGEQAVRQPWRMAASYLVLAFGKSFLELEIPFVQRLPRAKWRALQQMIDKGINSPPTSSLGRLFDAVAALIGPRDEVLYEGQAAIELEMLATRGRESASTFSWYPFALTDSRPIQLDVAPTIQAIINDITKNVPSAQIATKFHCTLAELFTRSCVQLREQTGLQSVALSGGVFQNRLLLELLLVRLHKQGFRVLINRSVPPNDGGLCLGQLAIAAERIRHGMD